MLKKYSQVFLSVLFFSDVALSCGAWALVYFIRFHTNLIPVYYGIPPLRNYLYGGILMVILNATALYLFQLYEPRRGKDHTREILDIVKATICATLLFVAGTFFYRDFTFSRLVILLYAGLQIQEFVGFGVGGSDNQYDGSRHGFFSVIVRSEVRYPVRRG